MVLAVRMQTVSDPSINDRLAVVTQYKNFLKWRKRFLCSFIEKFLYTVAAKTTAYVNVPLLFRTSTFCDLSEVLRFSAASYANPNVTHQDQNIIKCVYEQQSEAMPTSPDTLIIYHFDF